MTELDRAQEKFDSIKKAIEDKSEKGQAVVKKLLLNGDKVSAEAWAEITKNYFNYQIHEIRLMSVGKREGQKTYYEQFMLTFENNDTMFVYIDIK
jgi:hypothetical protein